jgi:hypothetical protein
LKSIAENCTDFWFVLPPVTFSKGFTVSIAQAHGGVVEKSTSKSISIERNKLSKMSPIEVEKRLPVPEAVDLGLPSGLKWASFNLGASKLDEYGDYYAWGETQPKGCYDWSTYKWCKKGSRNNLTKYCQIAEYGYWDFTDEKTVLDPEDDAAHVNLGGKWRMPTAAEIAELKEYCTWNYTQVNLICGLWATGPNGKRIFFPAAGYRTYSALYDDYEMGQYWSSSLMTDCPYRAYYSSMTRYPAYTPTCGSSAFNRDGGRSIRPVCD